MQFKIICSYAIVALLYAAALNMLPQFDQFEPTATQLENDKMIKEALRELQNDLQNSGEKS